MTGDPATDLHNEHAPRVLRLLMEPQANGKTTFAGTAVMLESVIFGALLVSEKTGFSAPHMLDAIYAAVVERLEADKRRAS